MNDLVSIIVPIYNSSLFLEECLASISIQSYCNVEVLLIDDGSTDESANICKKYCKLDSRFRYFYKKNEGVSSARNLALKQAKGNWIAFVDSDDVILKDYVSIMVEATRSLNNRSVLIITPNEEKQEKNFPTVTCCGDDLVRVYIKSGLIRYSGPVSKLYYADLIKKNNIQFPLGVHHGEDAIFILRYLKFADSLISLPICNYITNHNQGSLNTRYYSFDEEVERHNQRKRAFIEFVERNEILFAQIDNLIWSEESCLLGSFERILSSILFNTLNLSLSERIKYLKTLKSEDISNFIKNYSNNSVFWKPKRFCLKYRLFLMFIYIGYFELLKNRITHR